MGPCYTLTQFRERDQSIQDEIDAETEAARQEADVFSFGRTTELTDTRLEHMMTEREWLQKHRPVWMNDDQFECFVMVCDLFLGLHHVPGKIKECGPKGIELNGRVHWLGTFDFNNLTRAVFMAHDRCIRFEIEGSGPGMLKLTFHRRHKREGQMHERHPTVEQALAVWREHSQSNLVSAN